MATTQLPTQQWPQQRKRPACNEATVRLGELGRLANWNGLFQNARMFPRSIITTLRAAAARFPIVVVLGARQVGKTTLARAAFKTHRYLDLEDPRTAERFRQDARFELDTGADAGLILDEAQAVPSVFGALRGAVDAQRARLGRFRAAVAALVRRMGWRTTAYAGRDLPVPASVRCD